MNAVYCPRCKREMVEVDTPTVVDNEETGQREGRWIVEFVCFACWKEKWRIIYKYGSIPREWSDGKEEEAEAAVGTEVSRLASAGVVQHATDPTVP